MITNKEYVEKKGVVCPVCGSDKIVTTENVQVDGDGASQNCECHDCFSIWTDEYKLIGFSNVYNKDGEEVKE